MKRLLLVVLLSAPVFAQMEFSGEWAPVSSDDADGDPVIGEFVGVPLSRAGLRRAESWNASIYTLPEWQCRPAGSGFTSKGPQPLRIWKEVDPESREILAWHAEWLRTGEHTYYMDGRPHPSAYAPHSWQGFSTAVFEGDMLKISTTHLKEQYFRRNGMNTSDAATMTQYWIRRGDYFTWITITYDPVNFTEPMVRTSEYRFNPGQSIPPSPCTVAEEIDRPAGVVPHYLPDANPYLGEFGRKYNLPIEITKGGAATMYPEAARKLIREANLAGGAK
jgi:hypothetical protein